MNKHSTSIIHLLPVLLLCGLVAFTGTVLPQPGYALDPAPATLAPDARAPDSDPQEVQSPDRLGPAAPGPGTDGTVPLPSKIEPALLREMAGGPADRRYQFIVVMAKQADLPLFAGDLSRQARTRRVVAELQLTAQQTQIGLLSLLDERRDTGQVEQVRPFWILNGVAVTADTDTLLAIAARPDVSVIREDRWQQWVETPSAEELPPPANEDGVEWNIARIQANLVWDLLGLTGSGVTVGIMDTGVDWQHPALQEQYRGYNPHGPSDHEGNWFCATDENYNFPHDGYGHGTHVTGTAVGRQDDDGVAIGVAPGAQWIAVKTFSDGGGSYDSWIHAAFEWLLAPAGDPALAPDVVNASWGSSIGESEIFRPDVQALRSAGIVPVFSAGNDGPEPRSVGSPGSHPEAIAVGATDDLDHVTTFSSRGPSFWDETKPEVSAPGAQIRSSLPGGDYGLAKGTSMATPHVTGLVALLLQADPTLTVEEVEALLTSTAVPLGAQIPNNDTGWGRIDALSAAAVASQAGYVSGQVTRQPDSEPIPFALVTAFDQEGDRLATVRVDEDGRYRLAVPAGSYDIEASAFGYESGRASDLLVAAGAVVTADLTLDAAPSGTVWGQVINADSGTPVGAAVSVDGTPAVTLSDPQTGEYSLALPSGLYTVTVSLNGYRRSRVDSVDIAVGETIQLDFTLTPAPTLLLVDSGRSYYASKAAYFQSALEDRDYVYDLWEIRDTATDVPDEADLAPFDVTIWSSPLDSPGLIGAGDVISSYLTSGGNLLLTGQDVGYWDSGMSGLTWHPYYKEMLKAKILADDAGSQYLVGVPGDLFDGLTLPLNGPDSAGNQILPDVIDVTDPVAASLIGVYEGSGGGALRVAGCQTYHAVYLAAGLEGLGDRASRAEVMDRALTWLDAPHPAVEVALSPEIQQGVWLGDETVTYTVVLHNRGQAADRFDLELSPSDWPAEVMDGTFTQAITQSLTLSACQTQTVGVSVNVPAEIGWDVTDMVTLTARSQSDPGVTAQSTFYTKTPAPILLVDDHRWYDYSERYRTALEDRQLPYDLWRNPQTPTADSGSPTLKRLERYPVVVWFTGYDWYGTLTPTEEARLSAYLDGGGRLLLSSQDYLYTSGFTDFASDYLGILSYTEDLTVTQTVGAVGHPVGDGHAAMTLEYPFRNYSDSLLPGSAADAAFWGQHGQPVAVTTDKSPWKTAFYAFALEALDPDDLAWVMGNTVGWLSPLGDSTLTVDQPVVSEGAELAYTLSMHNTGPRPLANATLTNPLPPSATYVEGSLQGPAIYDPGDDAINWTGGLDPGQAVTVTYRLAVDEPLPDGTVIENIATLADETGLSLERRATTLVNGPYLGGSVKAASADIQLAGQVLTYTLALRNDGVRPTEAQLVDPIPANSTHIPSSGWASSGQLTYKAGLFVWTGTLGVGETVTVIFPVAINATIEGSYVYNRATLTDGEGRELPLQAQTLVGARVYLPVMFRGF